MKVGGGGGGGFDSDGPMPGGGGDDDDTPLPAAAANGAAGGADGNLLEQPYKVERVHIAYAKTAKRVDVKALKDSIWRKVSEPVKDSASSGSNNKKQDKEKDTRTFQAVLNELPRSLPREALADVSVPFAFICLLHLANEHNLELTTDGLQQLSITRTSAST